MGRVLNVHPGNTAVRLRVRFALKRRISHEQLVAQDAETPDVNHFVMARSLDHLWWKVVQRAT